MGKCTHPACDCSDLRSKALAKDRAAADELCKQRTPDIRRVVLHVLGKWNAGSVDCDEIVQDALIRMLDRMDSVRDEKHFCRWVRMMSRNLTIDHLRRLKQSRNMQNEPFDENLVADPSPPASLVQEECIQRIYERLSERSRQVYDLTAAGLERKEVAKSLGIEVRAVLRHLSKIRARLEPCWER